MGGGGVIRGRDGRLWWNLLLHDSTVRELRCRRLTHAPNYVLEKRASPKEPLGFPVMV